MIKSTGVVRKMDELGRVVIPIELRRTLGISKKDTLEIFVEENKIILKKYEPGCIYCGEVDVDKLISFEGKLICKECARKLDKLVEDVSVKETEE